MYLKARHAQFNQTSDIFGLQIWSYRAAYFLTTGQGERRRWVRLWVSQDGRLQGGEPILTLFFYVHSNNVQTDKP